MWYLAQVLLFLIGDLVPEDDEQWKKNCVLLSIMEYTLAPKLTREMANYLSEKIELFLNTFTTLYPDVPVTPKMHYIVHMPSRTKK